MSKPVDTLQQLADLAARVEQLAGLCQRLGEENRTLRQSQDSLIGERAQLLTKNEQARSRVEAMIHRLKSMEHNA
jgi:cell division protein ZapB